MPEDNSFFSPREKEELPRAGLKPATLYQLSHRGSSAGQAKSMYMYLATVQVASNAHISDQFWFVHQIGKKSEGERERTS